MNKLIICIALMLAIASAKFHGEAKAYLREIPDNKPFLYEDPEEPFCKELEGHEMCCGVYEGHNVCCLDLNDNGGITSEEEFRNECKLCDDATLDDNFDPSVCTEIPEAEGPFCKELDGHEMCCYVYEGHNECCLDKNDNGGIESEEEFRNECFYCDNTTLDDSFDPSVCTEIPMEEPPMEEPAFYLGEGPEVPDLSSLQGAEFLYRGAKKAAKKTLYQLTDEEPTFCKMLMDKNMCCWIMSDDQGVNHNICCMDLNQNGQSMSSQKEFSEECALCDDTTLDENFNPQGCSAIPTFYLGEGPEVPTQSFFDIVSQEPFCIADDEGMLLCCAENSGHIVCCVDDNQDGQVQLQTECRLCDEATLDGYFDPQVCTELPELNSYLGTVTSSDQDTADPSSKFSYNIVKTMRNKKFQ